MRWGDKPSALSSATRDEDAPSAAVSVRLQHPKAPTPVQRRAGPTPALTGTALGRSVRPGKRPINGSAAASAFKHSDLEASSSAAASGADDPSLASSSFLVCAGKGVGSNNDEHADDSSSSCDTGASDPARSSHCDGRGTPSSEHVRKGMLRSDSELELIISDLREKIALQHRLDEEKRHKAAASALEHNGALDSSRSSDSNTSEHHTRKHLKNPVERMSGNQSASSLAASMSNAYLLKRKASASLVGRLASGHEVKLAPPEVVATGIASTSSLSRASLLPSHGATALGANAHTNSGFACAYDANASLSRVYDDEGMLIRSYAQESGAPIYPSHVYSSTTIGPQRPIVYSQNKGDAARHARRVRKERLPPTPSFHLDLQRGNNASDSDSSSFSDDDDNPFLAHGALSPVGPWMAEGRPETDSFDLQLSSSSDAASPLSSARTDNALADLSPRSRLLWFSECADSDSSSSPALSTASGRHRQLTRSATHASTFRPSSAGSRQRRASGGSSSKPPMTRCSSAKPSRPSDSQQQQSRPSEAALRGEGEPKTKTGVAGKRRPQSSGARARKAVGV